MIKEKNLVEEDQGEAKEVKKKKNGQEVKRKMGHTCICPEITLNILTLFQDKEWNVVIWKLSTLV